MFRDEIRPWAWLQSLMLLQQIPLWLLVTTFVLGLGLCGTAALLSVPRVASMHLEVVELRHAAAIDLTNLSQLRSEVEAKAGSLVNLKELLDQAQTAMQDAQLRASSQDVKLSAMREIINALRAQIDKQEKAAAPLAHLPAK